MTYQVYKSKGVTSGSEDEQFLSDQVKFLAIAHNLAPETQSKNNNEIDKREEERRTEGREGQ